jgi:hypothetical protein
MGLMERDVRERFERIEENLERISESHLELEAAQKNTTILLNRFIEETGTAIKALTILVDQLIKRDLNGNGH